MERPRIPQPIIVLLTIILALFNGCSLGFYPDEVLFSTPYGEVFLDGRGKWEVARYRFIADSLLSSDADGRQYRLAVGVVAEYHEPIVID